MKSDNEILNTITSRFPNYRGIIMELFEESNSFSSLCEDYYECKAALDKLNCSKKREEIMRKEYEVILQEIEDELITNILLSRSKE